MLIYTLSRIEGTRAQIIRELNLMAPTKFMRLKEGRKVPTLEIQPLENSSKFHRKLRIKIRY